MKHSRLSHFHFSSLSLVIIFVERAHACLPSALDDRGAIAGNEGSRIGRGAAERAHTRASDDYGVNSVVHCSGVINNCKHGGSEAVFD